MRVLIGISRFFSSHASGTGSLGSGSALLNKVSYVHPLSEKCLEEFRNAKPHWFDEALLSMHPNDGTFSLKIEIGVQIGSIRTTFDLPSRNHLLIVECGNLAGRISLMDGSKSAWQSNIGDDLARIPGVVRELCLRIDEAKVGIYPGESKATPLNPIRPTAPSIPFPFPDNVKPPEG